MDLTDVVLLIAFFMGCGLTTIVLIHFQHIHKLSFYNYLVCLVGGIVFAGIVYVLCIGCSFLIGVIQERRDGKQGKK